MNAFEQIVSDIMQRKDYWTKICFKIPLDKKEKVSIGTSTMPAIEIDVLAYNPSKNELIWIECKSYLDSPGVRYEDLLPGGKDASRYKIFTDKNRRDIATNALKRQVTHLGLSNPNPVVKHWLVAGKIFPKNQDKLKKLFNDQGWVLKTNQWLVEELKILSKTKGYDDNVGSTIAKLIFRNPQNT